MDIKIIAKHFSNLFLAKAIFEDYCEVISSLTNVPIEEVRKRVINKANHLQDEAKSEIDQHTDSK